ncbi:MAG: hypothetical protein ABWW65_03480 [Thermoprotei archaeon]
MSDAINSDEVLREAIGVRVRYSTIVNYVSQIYRLLIAIGFTVVVTRKLSVVEYGLFTTILGLTSVLGSFYSVWCYWATRYYARGRRDLASTAFGLNLLYAPIASLLMILLGTYYSRILGWGYEFFVLGALIPLIASANQSFRSIVNSTKPYINGKTSIIRETIRFIAAYILVVILSYKLLGAVLSLVIALSSASIAYYVFMRGEGIDIPRPGIRRKYLLVLVKNSYIPVLITLYSMFTQFERPLLTALTASTLAAAYLGVSYIPRSVVLQSTGAFTSGLSARLLRIPSKEDIEEVLRISMVINIGMVFLLIVMAKPILSLFRYEYIEASLLFILFSIESFLMVLAGIFSSIATSLERADLEEHGLALINTPLFKIPLAMFLRGLVSIVAASTTAVALLSIGVGDPILIALPFPVAWLVSSIPFLLYSYRYARSKISFSIPWREVVASIIAGTAASIYLYSTGAPNTVIRSFWSDAWVVGFNVFMGALIYFLVLLLLSPWLRGFIKRSIEYYFGK